MQKWKEALSLLATLAMLLSTSAAATEAEFTNEEGPAPEGVALMVLSERATRCEEEKKAASRRMAAEQPPAPEPTPEVEEESWEDILEEVRR